MTRYYVAAYIGLFSFLGLLYAADANAAPFTSKYEAAYVAAAKWWGQEPTQCQSIEKQIIPLEPADTPGMVVFGRATEPKPGEVVEHCIYYLAVKLSPCVLKWTARHEYGHLLGLGHSDDPNDVMYKSYRPELCPSEAQGPRPHVGVTVNDPIGRHA